MKKPLFLSFFLSKGLLFLYGQKQIEELGLSVHHLKTSICLMETSDLFFFVSDLIHLMVQLVVHLIVRLIQPSFTRIVQLFRFKSK